MSSENKVEPLFPSIPIPAPRPEVQEQRALVLHRSMAAEPWMDEALYQARAGRRTAWIFAFILLIIVGAQAAAIAIMLPLKQVVPYTVTVDRQTGYVETARSVEPGSLQDDEAVVQSMLAQYVLARETFDPADFNDRYDRVALWSMGAARDQYVAQYQNGQALNDIRPGETIRVTIKKIELLSKDTARVRFYTTKQDGGAQPFMASYEAIITFRFTGAPMKMEDRFLNPLGFQAVGYRRDAEAITAAPRSPAEMAAPSPQLTGTTDALPRPADQAPAQAASPAPITPASPALVSPTPAAPGHGAAAQVPSNRP
jgi:type IV secretion system protein VirB8